MATEYVKGLERSRSSFEGGLYKSRCMAGFLVISDQTIADFSNRPKLEDDWFDGDGKYSTQNYHRVQRTAINLRTAH